MRSQKFIAYCTKGLEGLVWEEIRSTIVDADLLETSSKRILFESSSDFIALTSLKTVDDLGLFIDKIEYVEHFDSLLKNILALEFVEIKQLLQQYREILNNTFSFTIGFVGITNFTAVSLKQRLAENIAKKFDWVYTAFDHTNFDIRIFIDHTAAYISVRLTKESLYVRSYKQYAKPGSLKPTVAAAMVMLVSKGIGVRGKGEVNRVVDDFCGSGTILCEALSLKNEVYGGDLDAESALITRNNLRNLGFTNEDHIKHMDATKTHWPGKFFDCAISNLPWDKQIPVKSITNLYSGCLEEYKRIVKSNGTICLLVTKPELLIKHAKAMFANATIETIPISFQGQQPTIVKIRIHPNVTNVS